MLRYGGHLRQCDTLPDRYRVYSNYIDRYRKYATNGLYDNYRDDADLNTIVLDVLPSKVSID